MSADNPDILPILRPPNPILRAKTRLVGPGDLPHEKVAKLKGIGLVERIDDDHALILGQKSLGGMDLFAIPLP